MKLDTIGKNIRKFRLVKKLRQEDFAEKAGLSANYIGMVERGEKTPSLETFINIVYQRLLSLLHDKFGPISLLQTSQYLHPC